MTEGIVNYEGVRDLVKQHLIDEGLVVDGCCLNILPTIDEDNVANPRGLLTIHYWYNTCNGHYIIDIYTDSAYGQLSSQTTVVLENRLDTLYELVDYLYDNSINTEVAVFGASGHVTSAQNNTLCVNTIRREDYIDGGGYESIIETPIDTSAIVGTIFTSTAS